MKYRRIAVFGGVYNNYPALAETILDSRRRGAEAARSLAHGPARVEAWAEAARRVNPEIFVLVHGGPVAMPEDAEYVLRNTEHCHGFYGASSMERLPTEGALTEQTRRFKRLSMG